jgi:2-polyprenyl-3-methyl-5-hydroxy-6-metoxy-1,4-benzoquinol methylase
MNIISPITGNKAILVQSIQVSGIRNHYLKKYSIDVSDYFKELKNINLYKCKDSGYRFFYPFTISGDSSFYEFFQQFDWYYMPWKWEHQIAFQYINENMNVLEIGCAKGDFLSNIQKNIKCNCVGLEYNESTLEYAEIQGVMILNDSIQNYSINHGNEFDIVCSFQVLEHITDVKAFLDAQIKCLKKGGTLIISVPNNRSFIKYILKENILNLPPHHMGLWDKKSLLSLEKFFPLKYNKCIYEPIQTYHLNWYESILKNKVEEIKRNRILALILNLFPNKALRIVDSILFKILKMKNIHGHSIVAVYTKV